MSKGGRVGLVVVGLIVIFVGMVAWSFEDEYGSDTNFAMQGPPGGNVIVYDVDEQAGTNTPVFEGPEEEAMAYVEQRRSVGRDFLVPGLAIAVGVTMVLAGILTRSRTGRSQV